MILRLGPTFALTAAMAVTSAIAADKDYPLPDLKSKEWKKLENGIRIWDVKVGNGKECPEGATVKIHYTGWLVNGDVFDSSKKRGEPAEFPLGMLIKGWQIAVPGMKVGGKRLMELPPKFAYGDRDTGTIPAGSTLIFEIELLDVTK